MAVKQYKKKAQNKKASQARKLKNQKEKETSPKAKHYSDNKEKYKARSSLNFQGKRTKYLEKFKSRYRENRPEYKEKFAKGYQKNRSEHIRRSSARYQNNRLDQIRRSLARYRSNRPDHIRRSLARYRSNRPDHIRRSLARYRSNRPEHIRRSLARYRSNRPDHIRRSLARYWKNRTKINKQSSEKYYLKNRPERRRKNRDRYTQNGQEYKKKSLKRYRDDPEYYKEKKRQAYWNKKKNHEDKMKRRHAFRTRANDNEQEVQVRRRSKRTKQFALKGHKEKWINQLMRKLRSTTSLAARRLKAESLIKWAMKYRDMNINSFKQNLKRLKTKSDGILTKIKTLKNDSVDIEILGKTEHSVHTELFYLDPVYKLLPADTITPYVVNESGVLMNLFDVTRKKTWCCNPIVCKNDYDVDRMDIILTSIRNTEEDSVHDLLQNFDLCTSRFSNKMGHSIVCHTSDCVSQLVYLRHLSPHYPTIRQIMTNFYGTKRAVLNIENVNSAIQNSTLLELEKISAVAKSKGQEFRLGTFTFENEDDVRNRHKKAFETMTKKSQDLPIHPCLSCERLCYRRDTVEIAKLKVVPAGSEWQRLMDYTRAQNTPEDYICNNCLIKFRGNKMPASCIMNGLESPPVPMEISALNSYEKLLIQRAKAFQTVVRMGSVSGQRRPHNLLQKVVGRTFHLPLPIEETLKKLPSPTEAIPRQQELYVTIRGLPNKSKKIWQTNVDVQKVYAALRWLKDHNYLYKDILLETESSLQDQLEILDNDEDVFVIREDDDELIEEVNGNALVRNDQPAMLTQRSPDDEFYEQFTIQGLEGKKQNDTATNLYQMLKVQADPIDFRLTDLDLRCFPDLYPYGSNGQYVTRDIPLMPSEFVKNKVLSKHERFRLNVQYIFHLFHEVNIRALKSGIYHKLNIVGNTGNLSAEKCLAMLKNMDLEGNLTTIFARLRNSPQFWTKPRTDISTMITWYGPVTFFLTLSPSEYNWSDLDAYLRLVNSNSDGKTTSGLVATDPLSASRFIDNKFKAMLDFIQSDSGPIGKVTHFAWRREYQTRGLQHFHILIWVKDAPVIGISPNDEIAEFINEHITARKPDHRSFPTLSERVTSYQKHHHNTYCRRLKKTNKGKVVSVCRFGFPRSATEDFVLRDVSQSIAGRRNLNKTRLYDLPRDQSEEDINDYNPAILLAWNGNMDIQFIGEESCALSNYVTKYQTKAEKSSGGDTLNISSLCKSFLSNLWNIGLRTLSSRECGIMEACDTLLGLSLFGTDKNTTIKWLDVSMIRSRKLKTKTDIEKMDGSSEDIFCPSIVDTHYPSRPEALEDTCLFDFVSKYDIVKSEPKSDSAIFFEYPGVGFVKERASPCLIKHKVFNVSLEPEKYFHSLLLLFKPWRDFEDLKGSETTYADAFHVSFDLIDSAMKHHERLQYLRKSKEELAKAVECEMQKEAAEPVPMPVDQNLLVEAGNAMDDLRAVNQNDLNPEDLDHLISSLNEDQTRIFNHVVSCLGNEDASPLRFFVSGVGGTGKSFLIRTIKAYVRCTLAKDVAVTAPTGVAAHNIGGMTIHRLLQLPVEHGKTPVYKSLSDDVLKIIRDNMKSVILLIIDEISMVSNIMLLYIHFRLTEVYNTSDEGDGWFGKIHLIVLGDLLQLSPVMEGPPFEQISQGTIDKCVACIGSIDFWKELFTYDELTINVRQNKDQEFASILSRARIGALNDEDVNVLNTRLICFQTESIESRRAELAKYVLDQDINSLVILPTRIHCAQLNLACLELVNSEVVISIAEDSIDCAQAKKKKAELKLGTRNSDSEEKGDFSNTAGLANKLALKQDSKVMLLRNFDVTIGLVNGSLGRIKQFKCDPDGKLEFIQVQFDDNKLHDVERVQCKFELFPGAFVYRKQFPLTLAYAITVHKCQGMSIDSAILDIGQSTFAKGQAYVALSRVTTLAGIHLINFDPSNCQAMGSCIKEYNRLRSKYRSDLPSIPLPKTANKKVSRPDVVWVNKDSKRIDQEIIPLESSTILIPGFLNNDNVSCYANATLQALFHCRPVLQDLIGLAENPPLKTLAVSYASNARTLNAIELRNDLGAPFNRTEQQDASEFLMTLFANYSSLSKHFQVTLTTLVKCSRCLYEFRRPDEIHKFLMLPINIIRGNIQQLMDNYQDWVHLDETTCVQCSAVDTQSMKTEVKCASQFIALTLNLWTITGGKNTNFKLNALPSSVLKLNGIPYVLKSAIFHHGESSTSGHYSTILKQGNLFYHANDHTIKKERWPQSAKEIYVIVLEKK